MRAATAAAEPPLEPPVVRVKSQGLLVGPNSSGSVTGSRPYSGVLVLPAAGCCPGQVIHLMDYGVELGIEPFNAADCFFNQLTRLHFFLAYQFS